jgi:flagellar basal body-associated protein FliL
MATPARKIRFYNFVTAYMTLFGMLAALGYYALENANFFSTPEANASHGFHSDLAYYDLPRMTIAVGSGGEPGGGGAIAPRVRIDIALEVAIKDVRVIDGYQPRITDRLTTFLSHLTPDQIEQPGSMPWLHEQMLKQVNSAASPVPVHDLMFRQLVVM